MRRIARFSFSPLSWLAALLVGSAASADTVTKVSILTGTQENPPVNTPARGCGRYVVDTVNDTLSYHIVYSNLTGAETAAHLHGPADPGVNAGILHVLPAGNPKVGVWNYPAAMEADILAGRVYFNVHTAGFPGGELRGQIVDMVALLDGAQEVPANASPGQGYGLFNVDTCTNEVDYTIAYAGLGSAETAAHIHGYALHTVSAGVVHPLPAGPLKTGTWHYAEADEARILSGLSYVNVHTVGFPGGEVRGQIVNIVVPGDGGQEVPPNATTGAACGYLANDPASNTLSYHWSFLGLTGPPTVAHIHGFAPPGVNAGVQHNVGTANPAVATWAYGAGNAANVTGGLTYFNDHTAAFPGGEVRGQILFPTVRVTPCTFEALCFGIGCPCGNDDPTAGCRNSTGGGGRLAASGSSSVASDDLVLTATNLPSGQQGLYYMGDSLVNNPLFDGLQCALGTTFRFLTSIQNSGGTGTMTFGPGIVAASGVPINAGSTWYFHCWHRDTGGSPCGTGANLTHLVGVTFAP